MEDLLLSGLMFAVCLVPRFAFAGPPAEGSPEPAPSEGAQVPDETPPAESPPDSADTPADPTAIIDVHAGGDVHSGGDATAPAEPKQEHEPHRTADPGDARPNVMHKPLLEAKGKLGPQQMPASVAVYGIIATNAAYNSGTIGPTNDSPVFASVGSGTGGGLASDGVFLLSARQSRLGVKSSIQLTDKLDMTGLIELDFFGLHENSGPPAVVQSGLRLRLLKFEFGTSKHRFLAGQDFSVLSPRLPTSLSHMAVAVHTQSGAIYNRLPQLTYVFRQPIDAASKLGNARFQLQVSVVRSFSGDGLGGGITRADTPDPGTSSRLPLGQARVAFESDMFSLGVGGQVGRERYQVARLDGDGALTTIDDHVPIWMVTGDLQVKTKWVWVAGQGYYGVNINGMLSNQGVRHDAWKADEVAATDPRLGQDRDVVSVPGFGGWGEVGVLLGTPKVKLVGSVGVDSGRKNLIAEGARWINLGGFGGLIYAPFDVFDMSLEYHRLNTYYHHADPAAPIQQRLGVNNFLAATFRFKF